MRQVKDGFMPFRRIFILREQLWWEILMQLYHRTSTFEVLLTPKIVNKNELI